MGVYLLLSGRKRGGQSALLIPAVCLVPLAQNNPYAQVAFWGWRILPPCRNIVYQ